MTQPLQKDGGRCVKWKWKNRGSQEKPQRKDEAAVEKGYGKIVAAKRSCSGRMAVAVQNGSGRIVAAKRSRSGRMAAMEIGKMGGIGRD